MLRTIIDIFTLPYKTSPTNIDINVQLRVVVLENMEEIEDKVVVVDVAGST